MMKMELTVKLRNPHERQREFIESSAKRKCIRAGRRSGKTTGIGVLAIEEFLSGKRVLYAAPTEEQIERFWFEVKRALAQPIEAGILYKNETKHIVEVPGTEQRIRAKTAFNAETLRGDYADVLILDEYQLMKADAWELVGAPMLLDNNGDAIFIYTTKRGRHHSKELYKKAEADKTGRWQVFNFSSHDNPHLSREALADITGDMTALAYRMEIMAEEVDDDPRALWNRSIIDHKTSHPELTRVVVGVDPPGSAEGAECGIVVAGIAMIDKVAHGYVLDDRSRRGSPAAWGSEVVAAYNRNKADRVIGEANYGGDMVENTIRTVEGGRSISYRTVHASRGKAVRAEPVQSLYEKGRIHHIGEFATLEDEMCNWIPGESNFSPNRVDALVWALSDLILTSQGVWQGTTWRSTT